VNKLVLIVGMCMVLGMAAIASAGGPPPGGPPPGAPPLSPQDKGEIIALLKMDEAGFDEARAGGCSLAELAERQGVPVEAVVELVTKQVEGNGYRLDNDLRDGKITKEFYQEMKSRMPDAIHMTVYDKPVATEKK